MLGSKRFSISPQEQKAILAMTCKLTIGSLCAVAGLYLTKLDLGFWNVLILPLGACLTDLSLKMFRDTRYESGNPWTAPISGSSFHPTLPEGWKPWPGPKTPNL